MARGSSLFSLIAGIIGAAGVTLLGCAPEEPAPDTGGEGVAADVAPAPESEAPRDTAAAEPPPAEPAEDAGAEAAAPDTETPEAADAVDTSIRDATEFGDDSLLEGLAPDGWHQAGAIEHYNVARLYDKIDGRSELYMAYDVVGLSWVSFVHDDDPNLFMDVFVYDMGSPTGAFGIYSVEREAGKEKFDLGREGYRDDGNHYFWKGKYYVYVQTSLDEGTEAGLDVARKIADRLDDSGEPVQGLDLVPTEGLVDDTVQYFRSDAMSLDFMSDTFTAHYTVDGNDVTAFMTRRASDEDAAEVKQKFVQYLEQYGSDVAAHDADGVEITVGDLGGGYFDGVFRKGDIVAGVSAVEGADATLSAAKAILAKFE